MLLLLAPVIYSGLALIVFIGLIKMILKTRKGDRADRKALRLYSGRLLSILLMLLLPPWLLFLFPKLGHLDIAILVTIYMILQILLLYRLARTL
jgi:hypothetical protein